MEDVELRGGAGPSSLKVAAPALSPGWNGEAWYWLNAMTKDVLKGLKHAAVEGFEKGLLEAQKRHTLDWMLRVQGKRELSGAEIIRRLRVKAKDRANWGRWLNGEVDMKASVFQEFYVRFAAEDEFDHPLKCRPLWNFNGYLIAALELRDCMRRAKIINWRIGGRTVSSLEAFLWLHFYYKRTDPLDVVMSTEPDAAEKVREAIRKSVSTCLPNGRRASLNQMDELAINASLGWPWACCLALLGRPEGEDSPHSPDVDRRAVLDPKLHEPFTFDF